MPVQRGAMCYGGPVDIGAGRLGEGLDKLEALRASYLLECRRWTLEEIDRILPSGSALGPVLYDLMRDYPLRDAKALRPALAIATCRALGGPLEGVLPTAAALELYHNAFLIHDDIEDGSELRRGRPTLHRAHGVPIAINVGDAMLAISLRPLLDNTKLVGLGPALQVLDLVARMAWESAEGQAVELDWIRRDTWTLGEADYLAMVHKKTSWYTFITPIEAGAIIAEADEDTRSGLRLFAERLGAAFQIRDDVLNLVDDTGEGGKELAGDLWEGKRTLALLYALEAGTGEERARARRVLAKSRPGLAGTGAGDGDSPEIKTVDEVRFLRDLIDRTGALERATTVAERLASEALEALDALGSRVPASAHRDFLLSLISFVVERRR